MSLVNQLSLVISLSTKTKFNRTCVCPSNYTLFKHSTGKTQFTIRDNGLIVIQKTWLAPIQGTWMKACIHSYYHFILYVFVIHQDEQWKMDECSSWRHHQTGEQPICHSKFVDKWNWHKMQRLKMHTYRFKYTYSSFLAVPTVQTFKKCFYFRKWCLHMLHEYRYGCAMHWCWWFLEIVLSALNQDKVPNADSKMYLINIIYSEHLCYLWDPVYTQHYVPSWMIISNQIYCYIAGIFT